MEGVSLCNRFHSPVIIIIIVIAIYLSFNVGASASASFNDSFPSESLFNRILTQNQFSPVKNYISGSNSGDTCITKGRTRGICKNVKSCYPFFNLLIKSNSRPESWIFNLLRKNHCGFEKNEPVVCCPLDNADAKIKENHSNFNFLNFTCGLIKSYDRVIGGTLAGFHEFPWMALIGYDTPFGIQYNCGGSLISSRYILTAAHCITQLEGMKPTFIRLGEYNTKISKKCENKLDEEEEENKEEEEKNKEEDEDEEDEEDEETECTFSAKNFDIEEVIPHPEYKKEKFQNDIALIRLAERVDFTDYIQPICLPLNSNNWETVSEQRQRKGIVVGWGTTELGIRAKKLRKVILPILPLNVCVSLYKKDIPITESQMCAGGEWKKDSCNGDSGGPMQTLGTDPWGQKAYIQEGIVSFGPKPCGLQKLPGVYTKVSHYIKWILEHVKE